MGPTHALLFRTRFRLEASHTFKRILTTQHSALQWCWHVRAPHPPCVNLCHHWLEQIETAHSNFRQQLCTHRAGTVSLPDPCACIGAAPEHRDCTHPLAWRAQASVEVLEHPSPWYPPPCFSLIKLRWRHIPTSLLVSFSVSYFCHLSFPSSQRASDSP